MGAIVLALSTVAPATAATSVAWTQTPGCDFYGNSALPQANYAIAATQNQSSGCLATIEIRMGWLEVSYWYYNSPRSSTGEGGYISGLHWGADGTSGRHRSKVGSQWTSYKYTSY